MEKSEVVRDDDEESDVRDVHFGAMGIVEREPI